LPLFFFAMPVPPKSESVNLNPNHYTGYVDATIVQFKQQVKNMGSTANFYAFLRYIATTPVYWKKSGSQFIKQTSIMHITRRAADRGNADFGWLKSRHTFSFGNYFDEKFMGFGPLRVINEDRVVPGAGFGTHSHRDMEIISWVLEGTLEHKDSLGTGALIRPGELQRMTAGTGVTHSEFNASSTEPVHFLQIWIIPEREGLSPGYEQKSFSTADLLDQWRLVASNTPRDGAVKIHQDVQLYVSRLSTPRELEHMPAANRQIWLQVARGSIVVDDETLIAGDGAAWTSSEKIKVRANDNAELLLFDMAP
jgi:quercetin 2,3-dioxygenase